MSKETYSVLVTGGAGYIGAIMVTTLLADGHKVTVLDNFMYGQSSLNHACSDPNFTPVRGDARDEDTLRPLVKRADFVIPLAALVGAPICDRNRGAAVTTNRDAIVILTKILGRDQRILFPTTNSGYGVGESGKYCTEETPLRPVSLYGRTKVEAEEAVLARGNAISFRLATVFGMSPRMRIDLLVNDFVHRAVNDRVVVLFESHFKRNYIHIRDVTRVFQHGIANFEDMRDQAYNGGLSDTNISKKELAERIKGHVPNFVYLESPIGEDVDNRDYIVSNAKIEATGFKPVYSLDDGIRELIRGYGMITNARYVNA